MVTNDRPELPEGLPRQPGHRAGAAARARLGHRPATPRPALHASVGLYHNPHVNANGLDAMARNPPAQNTPSIIYGTMDTLLAVGRAGRVREPAEQRVRHRARRQDAEELQLLGRRPARARLGHGARRHLRRLPDAQRRDGNQHQPGARRRPVRRRQSAERRSRRTRPRPSRPSSCGPTSGYQNITIRSHFGTRALQLAAGAAQSPLHQRPAVRRRLHPRRRPSATAPTVQPAAARRRRGTMGPDGSTQFHNLVVNYTWDVPNGSRLWNNVADARPARRLAALGRHRVRQRRLVGRRAPRTTDNFDFTGGDGGTAAERSAATSICTSGNCDPTPGGTGQLLQRRRLQPARPDAATSATRRARSSGCRRSCMSNMSVFKNFRVGGGQRIQFRWEVYNVFNQVNWSRHQHHRAVQPGGPAGQRQLRPGHRGARARVMQGAIRFTF